MHCGRAPTGSQEVTEHLKTSTRRVTEFGFRTTLARPRSDFDPIAHLAPTSANVAQTRTKLTELGRFGDGFSRIRSDFVRCWPMLADVSRVGPSLAPSRPSVAESGPNSPANCRSSSLPKGGLGGGGCAQKSTSVETARQLGSPDQRSKVVPHEHCLPTCCHGDELGSLAFWLLVMELVPRSLEELLRVSSGNSVWAEQVLHRRCLACGANRSMACLLGK